MKNKHVKLEDIHLSVNIHFGLKKDALFEQSRKEAIVNARRCFNYLANNAGYGLSEIARYKGDYNHATISHSINAAKNYIELYEEFKQDIQGIESLLASVLSENNPSAFVVNYIRYNKPKIDLSNPTESITEILTNFMKAVLAKPLLCEEEK